MNSTDTIDWRVVFMLPPQRRFTADELARAAPRGFSATMKTAVGLNMALALVALTPLYVKSMFWPTVFMVLFLTATFIGGMQAWCNPSSTAARWFYWLVPGGAGLLLGGLYALKHIDRRELLAMFNLVAVGVLGLWFIIVYRHQFIESRLREQDERGKSIEMARRLAAAQMEPHFLFNTLAGLQHWVQTQDERAAPLLAALTGYLRATLPLFDRPLLAAGDELQAIERYLQVMQARLGPARLQWRIDVDTAARAAQLPPGLLLTLVENAVQHGVEPLLAGGELTLAGTVAGDELVFEVRDNGPGPAADLREGVGLANIRQRLALGCGARARLTLETAPGGGCRAEIRLPLNPGPVDRP
jgi:K+-sensing histidine kinase KdpD